MATATVAKVKAGKKAAAKVRETAAPEKAVPRATAPAPVRRTKSDARKVDERLAMTFKQLGDPTRLRVIRHLADAGAENVTGLCETMGMSQPAVSHHLSLMRHGGVVEATRQGKSCIYTLTPNGEVLAGLIAGLAGAQ